MKFWLGLTIGLVVGVGGTYLALERPWRSRASAPAGAEIATADTPDAGTTPRRGRRKGGVARGGGAAPEPYDVDDQIVLTAGDRVLEWRGDTVELPQRRFDLGINDEARSLNDAEMQAGIAQGSGAMIECIKTAVAGAPISAEVTLEMLVGGDGQVQKLRVRAPAYLHAHGLLPCTRRAARRFAFAKTGAPTIVTAPFHLN